MNFRPIKQEKRQVLNFAVTCIAVWLLMITQGLHAQSASLEDQKLIIENIRCEGNEYTRCSFITSRYYQKIGDIADPKKITNARLRLNTTSQFYYARARLEKGSEKGLVVVVFSVVEAPKITYGLGAFAVGTEGKSRSSRSSAQGGSAYGQIVNNNFLGAAKQLSFTVDQNMSNSEFEIDSNSIIAGEQEVFQSSVEQESKSTRASLNYFDPYLFGSSRYFMSLDISYSKFVNKLQRSSFDSRQNNTFIFIDTTFEGERVRFAGSLGRNLGRFSYVDITYSANDNDFEEYSIGYGWNREDNLIFATKGDLFDVRISKTSFSDRVDATYAKNFSISPKSVVKLSGRVSFVPDDIGADAENLGYILGIRFDRARSLALRDGRYSGWYSGLQYVGDTADFASEVESLIFSGGYKKLVNGVNLDLGLSYSVSGDLL